MRTRAVALGPVAVLLAGCTVVASSGEPSPAITTFTSVECPDVLVQPDPPRRGFGTSDPVRAAPALGVPAVAWLCEYVAEDAGSPDPDGGALYEWRLTTGPATVRDDALERVGALLAGLSVPPAERACTDDLGPRVLLTVVAGDRRIGLTIDDYGCREIRLTDDPWTVAPGEPSDPDLPGGVLLGPDGMLAELRSLAGAGRP